MSTTENNNLFSASNFWPSLGAKEMLFYAMLYPFIAASSAAVSIYTLLCGNAIAIGLHVIDWLKELSVSKKISERTSVGRERLDGFFNQILFSVRTTLILLLLFSLKFTFVAFCGTLHAVYAALFKKDGSVTGRLIRWVANGISHMIVGREIFAGASPFASGEEGSSDVGGGADANGEECELAGLDDDISLLERQEVLKHTNGGDKQKTATGKSEAETQNKEPSGNKKADPTTKQQSSESAFDGNDTPSSPNTKAKKLTAEQIRAAAHARGLNPNLGSGAKRKSSVKNSNNNAAAASHEKCEVIHEGPHFNRVARGCLLPIVE